MRAALEAPEGLRRLEALCEAYLVRRGLPRRLPQGVAGSHGWGLVAGPTSPWWVADNGTDVSTLYRGDA